MTDYRSVFIFSGDYSVGILLWFGFVVEKLLSIHFAIEVEFEISISIECSQVLLH